MFAAPYVSAFSANMLICSILHDSRDVCCPLYAGPYLKLVVTPHMSHRLPDMRGRPLTTAAVSVVVPPMSITTAVLHPDSATAPLRELTGPLLKVRIGNCCACADVTRVPSLPETGAAL